MEKDKSHDDFLNGLTPDVIAGYLKGTLPAEMIQKVARYLEENPFEAEAIEGFKSYTEDLDQELADLNEQLSTRIDSKSGKRTPYIWPAAAAISLLVVSGLIIYLLLPVQPESTPIAVTEDSAVFQTEGQTKTTAPDEASKPANRTSEFEGPATFADEIPPEQELEITRAPEASKTPEQKPEPAPSITKEKKEALPDDLAELQVTEETFTEDLVLEEAPAFNSRSAKSAAGLSTIAATPETEQPIDLPLAQSPEGWAEYLTRQLQYPDSAKSNGIQGVVKLRFHVDTKGNPVGFQFIQKLGYGCDQEALRVVKNGPLWNPASINGVPVMSQAEVVITFPNN